MQLSKSIHHLSIFLLGAYFLGISEESNQFVRTKRIIGGVKAQPNGFPWHAFILNTEYNGSKETSHSCGGILISTNWVLTSAHCLARKEESVLTRITYKLVIVLGAHSQYKAIGGEQVYGGKCVKIHKEFDHELPHFDVGLIELNGKVSVDSKIYPALLEKSECHIQTGDLVTVPGWGLTNNFDNNSEPEFLREVELEYISSSDCIRYYEGLTTDHVCCANSAEGGKDASDGDSGGGLVWKAMKSVVGILSKAPGLGNPQKPITFVRIGKFYDWIQEKTGNSEILWKETETEK